MTTHGNYEAGCLMVGDYSDEGEVPPGVEYASGEPVRPSAVAEFLDAAADTASGFTALLKQRGQVRVIGHYLKLLVAEGDAGLTYAVTTRVNGVERLVALFLAADVEGVYRDDADACRKSA